MTKDELISGVNFQANSVPIAMCSLIALASPICRGKLITGTVQCHGLTFELRDVVNALPGTTDDLMTNIHFDFFLKNNFQAAFSKAYELICAYSTESQQFDKFKAMPWYTTARIIRNAYSHDFKYRFDRGIRKTLPTSWGGHTIETSLEGQELDASVSINLSYRLIGEMRDFVNNVLI